MADQRDQAVRDRLSCSIALRNSDRNAQPASRVTLTSFSSLESERANDDNLAIANFIAEGNPNNHEESGDSEVNR